MKRTMPASRNLLPQPAAGSCLPAPGVPVCFRVPGESRVCCQSARFSARFSRIPVPTA